MMISLTTHICVTRPQWVKEYIVITLNALGHVNGILKQILNMILVLDHAWSVHELGANNWLILMFSDAAYVNISETMGPIA